MDKFMVLSVFIYVFGTFISAISQILLKKSADNEYKNENKFTSFLNKKLAFLKIDVRDYLNARVIIAYFIFFAATLCTVFAYKYVPLSMGPILGATEYIFVAVLSFFLLKEKMGTMKIIGLLLIIAGVIIFAL